jgi:hypothetical protein
MKKLVATLTKGRGKKMFERINSWITKIQFLLYPHQRKQLEHELYYMIRERRYTDAKMLMDNYEIKSNEANTSPMFFIPSEEHMADIKNWVAWTVNSGFGYSQYGFMRDTGTSAEDMLKNKMKVLFGEVDLTDNPNIERIEAERVGTDMRSLHWQAAKKIPTEQIKILEPIPDLHKIAQVAQWFDKDKRDHRRAAEREEVRLKRTIEQSSSSSSISEPSRKRAKK